MILTSNKVPVQPRTRRLTMTHQSACSVDNAEMSGVRKQRLQAAAFRWCCRFQWYKKDDKKQRLRYFSGNEPSNSSFSVPSLQASPSALSHNKLRTSARPRNGVPCPNDTWQTDQKLISAYYSSPLSSVCELLSVDDPLLNSALIFISSYMEMDRTRTMFSLK